MVLYKPNGERLYTKQFYVEFEVHDPKILSKGFKITKKHKTLRAPSHHAAMVMILQKYVTEKRRIMVTRIKDVTDPNNIEEIRL